MLNYSSRVDVSDAEHGWSVVIVQSRKTWYRVVVSKDKVRVIAPGLNEETEREDYPPVNNHEAIAIMAVATTENE